MPFFERLSSSKHVKPVPTFHHKDFEPLKSFPEGPIIVRDVSWSKDILKAIHPLNRNYNSFKPVFNGSKAKKSSGHGSRTLTDNECRINFAESIDSLFMDGILKPCPPDDIAAALAFLDAKNKSPAAAAGSEPAGGETTVEKNSVAHGFIPSVFGLRSQLEHGGPELGGMGCVRVAQEGTRNFACCAVSHIFEYMVGHKGFAIEAVTIASAYDALKKMVAADFQKMSELGFSMWRATVGPHEVLIIPSGMFSVDGVLNADIFGHKMSVALLTTTTPADLRALHLEATRRSNAKDAKDVTTTAKYCNVDLIVTVLSGQD